MDQTQTVQSVITGVVQTVAIIAPLAMSGTFGIIEALKKAGLSSKYAGLASYAVGFGLSILIMGVTTHNFFSPLSILIGVSVAFATPGVYSGVKAVASN